MSGTGRATPGPGPTSAGGCPDGPEASGPGDGRTDGDAPEPELPPACVPEPGGSCSICGDEGQVGEVVEVPGSGERGRVRWEDDGGTARVSLDLVGGVEVGDRVVVHMGFAIGRVRESEGSGAGDGPGAPRPDPPGGERGGTP